MSSELRRYPRVSFGGRGVLRVSGGEGDAMEVAISTLSARGAGVRLAGSEPLRPGAEVEIAFALDGQDIAMPARVVWSAGTYAGLSLKTGELCDHDRQVYGRWLVPRMNEAVRRASGA